MNKVLQTLLVIGLWLNTSWSYAQSLTVDASEDLFRSQFDRIPVPAWPELPDPFLRSPGFIAASNEEPEYKLEAILYNQDDPQAVINGEILTPGDLLPGGRKLSHIGPSYVHLEKGTSLIELALPASQAKRVSFQVGPEKDQK